MDWFVMRLPDTGGVGVVPGSSLEHHKARGWLRVSEALGDDQRDQLRLADYATTADLDAVPATPNEPATLAPAKSSKEK